MFWRQKIDSQVRFLATFSPYLFRLYLLPTQAFLKKKCRAFSPRSGLKIDTTFGVNPQLDSSDTGSLLDTIGKGQSAAVQSPYGVQSLMHALRQWEKPVILDMCASHVSHFPANVADFAGRRVALGMNEAESTANLSTHAAVSAIK